jgi:sugar/nucleoside kinase (ribokinase family)
MADLQTFATTLLSRGKPSKWVVLKLGANGCLIATSKGIYGALAFKVDTNLISK